MIKNTQIAESSTPTQSSSRPKRVSLVDLTGFAQMLNIQETQFNRGGIFSLTKSASLGSGRSGTSRDVSSLNVSNTDRNTTAKKSSVSNRDTDHSSTNEKSDNARSLSRSSESGQKRQGDSADSVDGCENGVQPGPSTEATVNAQYENGQESQTSPNPSETQASEEGKFDENPNDPMAQILSQMEPVASGTATTKKSDEKITIKTADGKTPVFGTNMSLPDTTIFFDTGLAGHFLRLLTDQFDQLKSGVEGQVDESATVQPLSMNASSSPASKGIASGAAASLQLPSSEDSSPDTMNKIVQVIRSNLGRRQSQMTVRLDPPELGKIKMDVKMVNNDLQLYVTTESAETRQILLNRMDTLRSALEQNGVALSKFEVVTKTPDPSSNQNGSQFQDQSQSGYNGGFNHPQGSGNFRSQQPFSENLSSSEDITYNVVPSSTISTPDSAVNLVA